MPDDQNTTQNPISEVNSVPVSSQEPTEPISQDIRVSEPINMPPEALETLTNADIPVSLNNANSENSPILTPSPEKASPTESGSVEAENPKVEPNYEPAQTSETRTAQIPVFVS